jgi:hypothetical protein
MIPVAVRPSYYSDPALAPLACVSRPCLQHTVGSKTIAMFGSFGLGAI